jgi:hypothetical protein
MSRSSPRASWWSRVLAVAVGAFVAAVVEAQPPAPPPPPVTLAPPAPAPVCVLPPPPAPCPPPCQPQPGPIRRFFHRIRVFFNPCCHCP